MKIIVGLGNPGDKYKKTRHNAGFMVLDYLANQLSLEWQKNKKFNSEIAIKTPPFNKGGLGGFNIEDGIILIKPMSYMNNSGQAIQAVLSYYKLLPKKLGLIKQRNSDLSNILTVIHDDIDIELGKYKISIDSRSAGHKGVESIINHLKTKNFKRVRVGVKTELLNKMPADLPRRRQVEAGKFVLQNFSGEELSVVNKLIGEIIKNLK